MRESNPWQQAKLASIQLATGIDGGFNIRFDSNIPSETAEELRNFVKWVELNFSFPVPLWVDFEYKHYLLSRDGKRCGYLFFWDDFVSRPYFSVPDKSPVIRLPVRTGRSTIEEILFSFIQAISCYFMWILNSPLPYLPEDKDCEEILCAYKASKFQA